MATLDKIILNGITYDLGGGSGLTDDLKSALDQLAQKVAYIDDDGQDYYNALYSALYPPANLSYITCVYTQSGTVHAGDSLNSLKSDLVVTAHYSNGTTQTVTSYTLSGTLTEGTSTITVSYGGKTTTFTVVVSAGLPLYTLYQGSATLSAGNSATISNGNHISLNTVDNSRTAYANESSLSNNRNNVLTTMFTVSSGDSWEIKLKNIVFTSSSSASNNFSVSLNDTSSTPVAKATTGDIAYSSTGAGTLEDVSVTGTFSENSNIGSLSFFIYRGAVFEFDFEVYINGSRYI